MLFPPGVLTFAVFVALCGSVLAIIAPFAPAPALLALACREFPDSTPRVARGAADGGLPVLPAAMAKVLAAAAAAAGWRSRRVAFSWSSMAYSHSSGSPGLFAPEWKTGLGGFTAAAAAETGRAGAGALQGRWIWSSVPDDGALGVFSGSPGILSVTSPIGPLSFSDF